MEDKAAHLGREEHKTSYFCSPRVNWGPAVYDPRISCTEYWMGWVLPSREITVFKVYGTEFLRTISV